jgi:hypothetical protein
MMVTKAIYSVLSVLILFSLLLTANGYSYEGDIEGLGGDTHYYLAYDVFAVDSLKPYFNELIRYGGSALYTYSNWATHANWEPDPQHSWGYFFDEGTLWNFDLDENSTGWNFLRGGTTTDEFSFGALLHGLADSAVPCKHAPVEWEHDDGHDYWESQAVSIIPNYTGQPDPVEYLSGSYGTKQTALYALKSAYVAEYQRFWNGTPPYRSLTELEYEAAKTMQIAADAVLKQYFDGLAVLTPDYILIDWTFDEGNSSIYGSNHQYIYNHHGSFNANLVRGRTHGADLYDGFWDSGLDRSGAWRGVLLSENSGGQTYCKSFGWTSHEARTLTKVGVDDKSFAMEFVVCPDSLPASSAEDRVNPPTLMNFYDTNGGPGMWHLTGFYKSNPDMHDCVRFDYMDISDGLDSLVIDLTARGFTVTPGKWYYVAVDYNYDVAAATGTLRLVVRDMTTGVYKAASKTALPAHHFYASSTPLMLIGGGGDDSDLRPFDGRIDRIRYHNKAIANSRRLGFTTTLAYWKFDENTGQLVQNTSGSSSIDLQFGSSTGLDTSDPTWTTGLYGSAMLGRKYTAGNVSVYSRDSGWTLKDKEAMSPGNSYSIETIVNPSSYASSGTWNNINPMGILKYWDSASGGKTQYLLRTYTDSDLHRKVRFYAQHADGTSTDFTFDPQPAGLTLNTGQWYYIGVIYTDNGTGSGLLELVVVDMTTGVRVSGTASSKPLAGLTDSPTTTFLVGSEYNTSSGRCFDGKIDEVRISNMALPESSRLYASVLPPPPVLGPEIKTIAVDSYSGYYETYSPASCVNGAGADISGAGTHSDALWDGSHWYDEYSARSWITLDLGGEGTLEQLQIWNANFAADNSTMWRYAQVLVSRTNPGFNDPARYQDLGQIEIPMAPRNSTIAFGTVFPISHTGTIRYVKLLLNEKWVGGTSQAGLAEIKCYGTITPAVTTLGPKISTVTVHSDAGHYASYAAAGCINGAGLNVNGIADTHDNATGDLVTTAWYNEYTNNPWIVLDLGGTGTLQQLKIWNANFFNAPGANWRYAQVQVSLSNPAFDNPAQYQDLGQIEIPMGPGTTTDAFGTVFPISHTGTIRYVKLRLNLTWNGGTRQAGLAEINCYGMLEPLPVPLTLIGYWPLDGNANDASGNGNHGDLLGGISWTSGQKGQCAQFNGTDTGIDIANPPNFEYTDEISLSFWVNQEADQSSYAMVLNKMSCSFDNLDGWMIFTGQDGWTTTGMNAWFKSTIDSYGVRTTPTCVGGWHHVAVTVKGTVLKVYFDGFLHEGWGYDLPGPMKGAAGNPLVFGHKSNPAGTLGSFWKGKLDEVRFYHGTLSQDEVINLYQQGGGIVCEVQPIPEDLNRDCRIDLADLIQLAEKWFECYSYNAYGCF